MNNKELENVLKLGAPERYEYFIKKVIDLEEIWGLYNNGWVEAEDDNGVKVLPFWPRQEFAKVCASNEWKTCTPKSIDLDVFINRWIPGMQKDGKKPCIFYTDKDKGIVIECQRLLNDLELELENY